MVANKAASCVKSYDSHMAQNAIELLATFMWFAFPIKWKEVR